MQLPALSAVTELFKPITWFPPMWAFACGVVASGVSMDGRWLLALVGVALAGPLVCATSQAVNDWYDRHVDAINEPQRPIPSGRIPGHWGLYLAIGWTLVSLAVATALGPWGFGAAALGLLLAWAYSAPPVRLKENGWWGNAACGISYEGIAWITGAAVMAGGAMPGGESLVLAALYSAATHGIMTLNDFKAVTGDRQMGVRSLPVQLGVERAAHVACWFMAIPQMIVIVLLISWHRELHAAALVILLTLQYYMMSRFVAAPVERALWYSGFGVPLFVSGMMVSAFALRGMTGGGRMTPFGWGSIARLGLVQMALGAIVVLTTSTLNRVMVVELALPALLPGMLVALHYLVQIARPRMGHGSDVGGRRTPWIVGGMAVLGTGGVVAALGTVWMSHDRAAGIALATLGFALVGLGVSAGGTSLLVMLAKRVPESRRAGAATLVWMMMIAGFALTAGLAGHFLEPYSPERLLAVTAGVSSIAFVLTLVAMRGLEGSEARYAEPSPAEHHSFKDALAQVWAEPVARRFTIFVFVSMLAYSAQDLILEPFAGTVFGYTPGASTQLSGVQHGGVLAGMLLVAFSGALAARFPSHPVLGRIGSLRGWTIAGCVASAVALFGLTLAGLQGEGSPLKATVFALGLANGAFSIGAIGSMMRLAGEGRTAREGVRMGLWGAAQAVAFGLGGLVGTGASDLARWLIATPGSAYATVFALEGMVFLVSAALAWRISAPKPRAAARSASFSNTAEAFAIGTNPRQLS